MFKFFAISWLIVAGFFIAEKNYTALIPTLCCSLYCFGLSVADEIITNSKEEDEE